MGIFFAIGDNAFGNRLGNGVPIVDDPESPIGLIMEIHLDIGHLRLGYANLMEGGGGFGIIFNMITVGRGLGQGAQAGKDLVGKLLGTVDLSVIKDDGP